MKNELKKSAITLGQPIWMVAGGQVSSVRSPALPSRRKFPETRRLRLANRTENDLASGIAYFVLAGSLFASLLEFFASLPA
ncbi:MAG TPA: hypothetical protein VFO40_09075 [Chthoniobacterales bacterium]|nr:hypothetical protein [Chthoniobacterales bacterium]